MSDVVLLGGDEFGRSSIAGRRVYRECPPAVQAQGADGRHHQGSEASLLLPKAGREASSEASLGAKACSQEDSQRARLSSHGRVFPEFPRCSGNFDDFFAVCNSCRLRRFWIENDGLQCPAVNDFRSMMVGFAGWGAVCIAG